MSCHGGFALEEKLRRTWYNPEAILNEAGLREGMTFVDVGCGDGFFTLLAAQALEGHGTVFCVDVDLEAIERLKAKAEKHHLTNIRAKVAAAEETVFCQACADVVFYSMVLHDFTDPAQVLQNARKMLKPTGAVVDLDWKKLAMPFGPPVQIRFTEEKATELIKQAGFSVESAKEAGPYHYMIIAKTRA